MTRIDSTTRAVAEAWEQMLATVSDPNRDSPTAEEETFRKAAFQAVSRLSRPQGDIWSVRWSRAVNARVTYAECKEGIASVAVPVAFTHVPTAEGDDLELNAELFARGIREGRGFLAHVHRAASCLSDAGLPTTPPPMVAMLRRLLPPLSMEWLAARWLEQFDRLTAESRRPSLEEALDAAFEMGALLLQWKMREQYEEEVFFAKRRRSQLRETQRVGNLRKTADSLRRDKRWAEYLKRHGFPPFGVEGSFKDAVEGLVSRFGGEYKSVKETLKKRLAVVDSPLYVPKKRATKRGNS